MTNAQIEILQEIFSNLSEEQKQFEILRIPYSEELKKIISAKENIRVNVSDVINNTSLMTGYSGVQNILKVINNEIVLKPNLILQILEH